MPSYFRLTLDDRCRIEAQLEAGRSVEALARLLGYHQSTIYRELSRNSGRWTYRAQGAHERAQKRKVLCRRKPVLTGPLCKGLESRLRLGWSPEQIAGRWKRERYAEVSHQTIYRHVRRHHVLRTYLRRTGKRGAGRYRQRRVRPQWMRLIHSRPAIVLGRKRFGDWERDTMFTLNRRQLLVLTERKSRLTKLAKIEKRTTASIAIKTTQVLRSVSRKVHTITNDNDRILWDGDRQKVPVYYCDPMAPQQRGTIENTIGLLRQYIGRKTDLDQLGQSQLAAIERILNTRPRKCLDYRTPYEVFENKTLALAM